MKILILSFLLLSNSLLADMNTAKEFYNKSDYKRAFKELQLLSKLGISEAHHYMAKSYFDGNGVEQNLTMAHAWSVYSELGSKKYSEFTIKIASKLSSNELEEAKNIFETFKSKYSDKKIRYELVNENDEAKSFTIDNELSIFKAPKYPTKLLYRQQEGYVAFSFLIYPDGSVRDINIEDEFPAGAFTESAIEAISKYNIAYKINGKKEKLQKPMPGIQTISYKLSTNNSLPSAVRQKILKSRRKALEGDVYEGMQYYYYFTFILGEKGVIDYEQINKWLLRAADFGYLEAQYIIGVKMYYGINIVKQKQLGLNQLVIAAAYGDKKAQYLLYQLVLRNEIKSKFDNDAYYWLDNATENNSINAKLSFVKYVSKLNEPSKKQIKRAKKYLKEYSKQFGKIADWYHAKALLDAKNKRYIKAVNAMNNAIRHAREAHWDITILEEQHKLIKQHKQVY